MAARKTSARAPVPVVQAPKVGDAQTQRALDTLVAAVQQLQAGVPYFQSGKGSPEGRLAAPVGTLYTCIDGSAAAVLYVKEQGTGKTGWVAK